MQREVRIAGLTLDPSSNTPILVLKTVDDDHSIPIWIGLLEATSIATALQKINFDRPMTHDLFKNFMEKMQVSVVKIEVCDLKDNTFYARIFFASGENTFDLDARPSDAIAIAIRFQAPIFVDDQVIEKFKQLIFDKLTGIFRNNRYCLFALDSLYRFPIRKDLFFDLRDLLRDLFYFWGSLFFTDQ